MGDFTGEETDIVEIFFFLQRGICLHHLQYPLFFEQLYINEDMMYDFCLVLLYKPHARNHACFWI